MPGFTFPAKVQTAMYRRPSNEGLFIDASTANQGYVTAGRNGAGKKAGRLKFQVRRGSGKYNYDLPDDGTVAHFPVNMGDGAYTFRILECVSGTTYRQVLAKSATVKLDSQSVPYVVPNVYCDYAPDGPSAKMARLLCAGCKSEVEAVIAVCKWVATHVRYDTEKATRLASTKGYVPHPDATIAEGKGVCFDIASLTAAMLRVAGIPCRVVTGYIDSGEYHAWVVAYADGRWRRADPTLMAANKRSETYTDRYTF